MYRSKRKDISVDEMGIKSSGGILDLMDNSVKSIFRITNKEYDFICETASDEELELLISEAKTISDKKKLLLMIDKYILMKANFNLH